jgi:hypothetical protein
MKIYLYMPYWARRRSVKPSDDLNILLQSIPEASIEANRRGIRRVGGQLILLVKS